jgi:ethanolamine utilization protein EutM
MKALGMIEVYGYPPAVVALDSALKAADVSLTEVTKVKGGLVAVMFSGEVAAVKSALDASAAAASLVGQVVSVQVIARPVPDLDTIVDIKSESKNSQEKDEVHAVSPEKRSVKTKTHLTDEEIEHMTVAQLRSLTRKLGVQGMKNDDISFAKKIELTRSIRKHLKGE